MSKGGSSSERVQWFSLGKEAPLSVGTKKSFRKFKYHSGNVLLKDQELMGPLSRLCLVLSNCQQ